MAELKPGPAPTGRDKLFDALYGALGGTPDKRWAADKLATALDYGTLGMLTGAYDGGRELAQTGSAATLAMALMPGAKGVKAAAPAAKEALSTALAAKYPSVDFFIGDRPGKPLIVSKVVVPEEHRGAGIGTSFMNDVLARADQDGRTVALSPSSDFGGDKSRLEKWYKSLGFVENKGKAKDYEISESMYRRPTGKVD